ncbi:MAG: ATP-binding protein [Candidatus Omnitrophota bacterium]
MKIENKAPVVKVGRRIAGMTLSAKVFYSVLVTEFIIMVLLSRVEFLKDAPQIVVAALDTFLLGLVIIAVIHFSFRPLVEMLKSMEKIESGQTNVRLKVPVSRELASLAEGINHMLGGLAESYHKVEESENLLAGIADGIDEEIMLIDKDFKIIWANKKARESCSIPSSEVIGNYCYKLTHSLNEPCKFPLHGCPLQETGKEGKVVSSLHTHFDMKGNSLYVEVAAYPLYDEKGKVDRYIHISRDVTDRIAMIKEIEAANEKLKDYSHRLEHMVDERTTKLRKNMEEISRINEKLKKTQSQLVQTGKMAAVGQLASGVAHEINNPLAIILNNIQLIKIWIQQKNISDSDVDFASYVKMVEDAVSRCKKITQALHDFSHVSQEKFELFYVNDAIEKTLALIEYETTLHSISFEKDLQANMPKIFGDFQALQQVFLDIIVNARWAIEKHSDKRKGLITIKTVYEPGDHYVRVFIMDSGIGISEKNISRIFEAFFTTKEVGEGTGLGLSIAYNIIRQHHGNIEVKSMEGEGATFVISLPLFGEHTSLKY